MENDFINLDSVKNQDIRQYLCIGFEHLKEIISNLENLVQKNSEKEHVVDILEECLYIKKEIIDSLHNYEESNDQNTIQTIENHFKNIFSIEEDLIIDHPEVFKNHNTEWWKYVVSENKENRNSSIDFVQPNLKNLNLKNKNHTNFKRWAFGIFFLLPVFLFIILYPIINNKIHHIDEPNHQAIYEHDRAYKNIYYIYSAVLSNHDQDSNFYSLFKTSSFQMPEGFVVMDKNRMVDYYLKEYYELHPSDDHSNIVVISVNNLNSIQCKYILTKFSGIPLEKFTANNQIIDFNSNFTPEIYCHKPTKTNSISLYVKKN